MIQDDSLNSPTLFNFFLTPLLHAESFTILLSTIFITDKPKNRLQVPLTSETFLMPRLQG